MKIALNKLRLIHIIKFIVFQRVFIVIQFLYIVIFILFPNKIVLNIVIKFQIIMLLGLLGSFVLHEYVHILCMKIFYKKNSVKIVSGFTSISIIPCFKIYGKNLLIISMTAPLVCFIVGLVLYCWKQSPEMKYISYFYMFHIINLIPPMGDGMMIMKALLDIKSLK